MTLLEKQGITFGTLRNAISKGRFKPDQKINNRWYVEEDKSWYATRRWKRLKNANSYSRVHNIWSCMKQRCYNKKHNAYYRYGGRGIKVCDEWKNNADAFIEWALNNGYNDNLELDRIDNDGNYEPSNCQWLTRSENRKKAPKPYSHNDSKAIEYRFYKKAIKDGFEPSEIGLLNPYE